jgi:hypothetical protein
MSPRVLVAESERREVAILGGLVCFSEHGMRSPTGALRLHKAAAPPSLIFVHQKDLVAHGGAPMWSCMHDVHRHGQEEPAEGEAEREAHCRTKNGTENTREWEGRTDGEGRKDQILMRPVISLMYR